MRITPIIFHIVELGPHLHDEGLYEEKLIFFEVILALDEQIADGLINGEHVDIGVHNFIIFLPVLPIFSAVVHEDYIIYLGFLGDG